MMDITDDVNVEIDLKKAGKSLAYEEPEDQAIFIQAFFKALGERYVDSGHCTIEPNPYRNLADCIGVRTSIRIEFLLECYKKLQLEAHASREYKALRDRADKTGKTLLEVLHKNIDEVKTAGRLHNKMQAFEQIPKYSLLSWLERAELAAEIAFEMSKEDGCRLKLRQSIETAWRLATEALAEYDRDSNEEATTEDD